MKSFHLQADSRPMVNITQAALAAFSSCILIDFQGFFLTNWANLPPPLVSNIPATVLAPGPNTTAGQVWNITLTGDSLGPFAVQNFTTGMFLGFTQSFLQSFTQAVLQGTQANFNIRPALGIPGAFTITAKFGDAALTSWKAVSPLDHGTVTWEFFTPGFAQQAWSLRNASDPKTSCVLPA
ncbi:hypothetical protein GGX14DRAFT_121268 [Mycena pura]|uniref:Uncharacterized protein n=1 Tax=Mycena pura TaxID=153505 RepID=A0AAD6V9G3_9AGAR|nr:hypothetical protein GGX14DRAFT_121268 [Mycena pura]